MAKSDYICKNCKEVKGSNFFGAPTEKYKCDKHGFICKDCVDITVVLFGRNQRSCKKCEAQVLLYEYNSKRNRWEKA